MLPFHGLPHHLIDNFFGCTEDICFHGITVYHSLTKSYSESPYLCLYIQVHSLFIYPGSFSLSGILLMSVICLEEVVCHVKEKKSFHSSRCFTSVFPEINSEDAIFSLMYIL